MQEAKTEHKPQTDGIMTLKVLESIKDFKESLINSKATISISADSLNAVTMLLRDNNQKFKSLDFCIVKAGVKQVCKAIIEAEAQTILNRIAEQFKAEAQ